MDISQIEATRLAITKEKTDLRHTVLEVADLIIAKGLKFDLELPAKLPEVWIDRTRIRQVILNLLTNAVRFTDEGTITLPVSQDKGMLIINVKDTGIGVAVR